MDLRVQFEAIRAFGHRDEDVQTNPLIGGDVGRRAFRQLRGRLMSQFDQAQRAGIDALAQGLEQRLVFGKGTQRALGFDHLNRFCQLQK